MLDYATYDIILDESRKIFTNKELDFAIIEIKPEDKIDSNNYLEIDEIVLKNDNFSEYLKNGYLLGLNNRKTFYSTFRVRNINKFYLSFYCETHAGTTGAPLINSTNNKVIGLNLGVLCKGSQYNVGIIIKYMVKEFLKFYLKK